MSGFTWVLNDLIINTEANDENRRALTLHEILVLGWLVFYTSDRHYSDLLRECKLTPEQCHEALQGLLELDLIRVR
ncbi:MAG: hypothetical protein F6J93_39595 [Oscillatoria sp. SIO1A7]|nr:hypothetical protein [Oscillatoria sp. SIO1A7]